MDSFDFDRLDPIALEQTLSYLSAFPEPQDHDVSFLCRFADAVAEKAGMESQSRKPDLNCDQDGSCSNNIMPHVESCAHKNQSELIAYNDVLNKKGHCTWHECQYIPSSDGELTRHLKHHAEEALREWSPPSRCMWTGCQSKATFKNRKSFHRHLTNIHTKPLVCTAPRCSYKKPFRGMGDLARHRSTVHSDIRVYECPFDTCEEEVKNFARKDKWLKHIRETPHENDGFCPYLHCERRMKFDSIGFQNREEIVNHFNRSHTSYKRPWNCALGSCAWNYKSEHWSYHQWNDHIREHHGVHVGLVSAFIYASKFEEDAFVLRAEYLDSSAGWHDCTICTQQQQRQREIQINDRVDFPGADVTCALTDSRVA